MKELRDIRREVKEKTAQIRKLVPTGDGSGGEVTQEEFNELRDDVDALQNQVDALPEPLPEATSSQTSVETRPDTTDWQQRGDPATLTFTAPESGRVQISVGGGIAMPDGTARCQVSYEVREGSSSGVVVQEPSGSENNVGTLGDAGGSAEYKSRVCFLEGLTPGEEYWATTMERITSSGEGFVFIREILVVPLP